jgi:hypothetical protein
MLRIEVVVEHSDTSRSEQLRKFLSQFDAAPGLPRRSGSDRTVKDMGIAKADEASAVGRDRDAGLFGPGLRLLPGKLVIAGSRISPDRFLQALVKLWRRNETAAGGDDPAASPAHD